ncbi:MAG: c-type cytochrome [Acidobacteriaceae bacterium]|nr:c-type cytochrome [Acidobacteriaceae bacterium]
MMRRQRICLLNAVLLAATAAYSGAQTHQSLDEPAKDANKPQLPNTPGKETVLKLCGSCHSVNIVLGKGMNQEGWSDLVASMISRGAKGTESEFTEVIDYLAKNFPPNTAPGGTRVSARKGGGGGFTVGPDDKQIVDPAGAERGKKLYAAQCITCHGPAARGNAQGPDLVRSVLLLHDRYGSTIGPYLGKGHPTQSGVASASFTKPQVEDLSHFLHQKVNDTLVRDPYSSPLNVLTGDPKAGAQYFNGAGRCNTCHSPTGDFAGLARKYDPAMLQQRFLFPKTISGGRHGMVASKPVTVTVTPPNGQPVSGVLDRIDDFNVSLRDASGEYHSWKRTSGLKVERNDPYATHDAMLEKYTDQDIHNVVAYLETLK